VRGGWDKEATQFLKDVEIAINDFEVVHGEDDLIEPEEFAKAKEVFLELSLARMMAAEVGEVGHKANDDDHFENNQSHKNGEESKEDKNCDEDDEDYEDYEDYEGGEDDESVEYNEGDDSNVGKINSSPNQDSEVPSFEGFSTDEMPKTSQHDFKSPSFKGFFKGEMTYSQRRVAQGITGIEKQFSQLSPFSTSESQVEPARPRRRKVRCSCLNPSFQLENIQSIFSALCPSSVMVRREVAGAHHTRWTKHAFGYYFKLTEFSIGEHVPISMTTKA
jgi:hypothetical protein